MLLRTHKSLIVLLAVLSLVAQSLVYGASAAAMNAATQTEAREQGVMAHCDHAVPATKNQASTQASGSTRAGDCCAPDGVCLMSTCVPLALFADALLRVVQPRVVRVIHPYLVAHVSAPSSRLYRPPIFV